MKHIKNIAGWYGVLAILSAYILLTFKVVPANGWTYQLLNVTGSLGIISAAIAKKDIQPVVLNTIWALVAMIAIIRLVVS